MPMTHPGSVAGDTGELGWRQTEPPPTPPAGHRGTPTAEGKDSDPKKQPTHHVILPGEHRIGKFSLGFIGKVLKKFEKMGVEERTD